MSFDNSNDDECQFVADYRFQAKRDERQIVTDLQEDDLFCPTLGKSAHGFLSTLSTSSFGAHGEEEWIATMGSDTCQEVDKSATLPEQEIETFGLLETDHLIRETRSPSAAVWHAYPPDETPQKKRKQGNHGHQVSS
jgi:hypothetical protein